MPDYNSLRDVRIALSELQVALRKLYGSNAPTLLLYGSFARGEANTSSDVDVLLLYSGEISPGREIHRIRSILADLNLRYQVLITVLPVSMIQYQTSPRSFWNNVRHEGVPIDTL